MARAKITICDDGLYYGVRIDCPGCGHKVINTDWTPPGYRRAVRAPGTAIWTFDGNLLRPTFMPSLLWRSGHYCGTTPASDCAMCKHAAEHGLPSACCICHSWVRDGRIQFLPDCTHQLAGQTVDLPEVA